MKFWRRKPAEVDLEARREPVPKINVLELHPKDLVVLTHAGQLSEQAARSLREGVTDVLKTAGHASVKVMVLQEGLRIDVVRNGPPPPPEDWCGVIGGRPRK